MGTYVGGPLVADSASAVVCSIRALSIGFRTRDRGVLRAVDGVSLEIHAGEAIGIVGESGSGKSMLALSMLALAPENALIAGEIRIGDENVLTASRDRLYELRGRVVGLILQDPVAALNPVRTIESQMTESGLRTGASRSAVRADIRSTLDAVGLAPREVLRKFPFQLSGGMNQRIAIAMALLQHPKLLIADEPTTALDVSTQVGILGLLQSIQRDRGMALVLISHDLAVVYQVSARIAVMYAGKLVEVGPTQAVVGHPAHPYTSALIGAIPSLEGGQERLTVIPGQLTPVFESDIGCPFRHRCPHRMDICEHEFPPGAEIAPQHTTWCWLHVKAAR